MKLYGIWGIGYKSDDIITDFEKEYMMDASYEAARKEFDKLTYTSNTEFFKDYPDYVKNVCLQIEELGDPEEETEIKNMVWFYRER